MQDFVRSSRHLLIASVLAVPHRPPAALDFVSFERRWGQVHELCAAESESVAASAASASRYAEYAAPEGGAEPGEEVDVDVDARFSVMQSLQLPAGLFVRPRQPRW